MYSAIQPIKKAKNLCEMKVCAYLKIPAGAWTSARVTEIQSYFVNYDVTHRVRAYLKTSKHVYKTAQVPIPSPSFLDFLKRSTSISNTSNKRYKIKQL